MANQRPRGSGGSVDSARSVAVEVLYRVAEDGAWASRALDGELVRAQLDPRDAALATAITYGALRQRPTIDALIDARAAHTDPYVRAVLRGAIFEILFLDRVPVRAAVHQAVGMVRRRRGPKVGGFVNALLRRIERPAQVAEPQLELPSWLEERLTASVGAERAASFRTAKAHLDVRVFGDRDAWCASLDDDVKAEAFGRAGVRLEGAGDPRRLPGHIEGTFAVQEQGSQAVAEALGVEPGEHVADCCAGRGGKSVVLGDALGPDGTLTAFELHASRLKQIAGAFARHDVRAALQTETVDLRVGTGGATDTFDRVLVDAPCTGTGTVHRRPEILLRLEAEDVERLQKTQRQILENAAKLVKPGGVLVFAVCSLLREEGPDVVHDLPLSEFAPWPLEDADEDGWTRLGPWRGSDGYQIHRWRRAC